MQGIAKLKWFGATALIGLMALVVASPASAGLIGEGSPLSPYTGNIRGTITDGNGEPVEELEVCAMTEQTNPAITYCAKTEEGGQYLIYNVPQQGYKVWAQSLTYLQGWPQGYPQIFYPGVGHYEEATWVQVHAEQTTTGIDFQVHKGGEITGTVTDQETGNPVEGVKVCPTWVGGPTRAEVQFCSYTDAAGEYLIQNVDTDEYTVEFDTHWSPEYEAYHYPETLEFESAFYQDVPTVSEATPVSVTAGQTTEGIDAHLTRLGASKAGSGSASSSTGGSTGSQGQSEGLGHSQAPVPTVTFKHDAPTRFACKRGFRKTHQGRATRCVKIHKKKATHPVAHATRH